MSAIKFNPTLLRKQLEDPKCRAYFGEKYENIMTYYWKFLKDAGPNCTIVQAALKALWTEEMHSASAESFQEALSTGTW